MFGIVYLPVSHEAAQSLRFSIRQGGRAQAGRRGDCRRPVCGDRAWCSTRRRVRCFSSPLAPCISCFATRCSFPARASASFCSACALSVSSNGRPCGRLHSAQRNCILLVPGLNVVAVALEGVAISRDPQGQRLGDTLANTQVVEGLSARELVTSLQRALMDVPHGTAARQAAGGGEVIRMTLLTSVCAGGVCSSQRRPP